MYAGKIWVNIEKSAHATEDQRARLRQLVTQELKRMGLTPRVPTTDELAEFDRADLMVDFLGPYNQFLEMREQIRAIRAVAGIREEIRKVHSLLTT